MPLVTLIGYYGRKNIGDDIMLSALESGLHDRIPGCRINICSAAQLPIQTRPATHVIVTPSLVGRVRKLASLAESKTVIWGGGTCLYEDGPGGLSGLRGLRRMQRICRLFGTRFALIGVGVGDIHTFAGRRLVSSIISDADLVVCREAESVRLATELAAGQEIHMGGDLAFLAAIPEAQTTKERALKPRIVAFCGTSYHAGDADLVRRYRAMIEQWLNSGVEKILFIPMHQGTASDNDLHYRLSDGLLNDRHEHIAYATVDECLAALRRCDAAVSFRLHGVVLADFVGTPCLAVAYSPKVAHYCTKIGDAALHRLRKLGAWISSSDLSSVANSTNEFRQEFTAFRAAERRAAASSLDAVTSMIVSRRCYDATRC